MKGSSDIIELENTSWKLLYYPPIITGNNSNYGIDPGTTDYFEVEFIRKIFNVYSEKTEGILTFRKNSEITVGLPGYIQFSEWRQTGDVISIAFSQDNRQVSLSGKIFMENLIIGTAKFTSDNKNVIFFLVKI